MRPITIVEYDPAWAQTFEQLRDRIWPAVKDLAIALEHVGSTSVVGLAAKPVIDMTIVLANREPMRHVIGRLSVLGYEHRGDLGIPGREAFDGPSEQPAHHLYACAEGELPLRNHLALREHLRVHPGAVREYGDLKRALAQRFPYDIDAYVDGKTDFILSALAAAGLSEAERNAIAQVNRPSEGNT